MKDNFVAKNLGLYPYQTKVNNKSVDRLAGFLIDVLGLNGNDCNIIEQAMKNYLDSIDRAALRSRAEQMLHTAGDACDQAGRFVNTTTEKIRGFSLIEFFIYETCLLSFGLWLGTCFSKFFKKFRAIIFAAFAATWLYLLWRVFFDEDED